MKTVTKYPKCFPENFEADILPKEAKEEEHKVFRLIKSGIIDREAFISSYEEILRNLRPRPKSFDPNDPGEYSTSCFIEYEDAEYLKKVFMRHNPEVIIAEGMTEPCCGPSQITAQRVPQKQDSHVDWWVYEAAEPHMYFKKVKK